MNQNTRNFRHVKVLAHSPAISVEVDGYAKHDHLAITRHLVNDRLFVIMHIPSGYTLYPFPFTLTELTPLYDYLCSLNVPWQLEQKELEKYLRATKIHDEILEYIRKIKEARIINNRQRTW